MCLAQVTAQGRAAAAAGFARLHQLQPRHPSIVAGPEHGAAVPVTEQRLPLRPHSPSLAHDGENSSSGIGHGGMPAVDPFFESIET